MTGISISTNLYHAGGFRPLLGGVPLRRLAEDNLGRFAVYSGNRYLIIRTKFEKFVDESSAI